MKIAMFTNTYLPHVGGVAKSIKTLEDGCRAAGHEVRVIAPDFEGAELSDDVIRVPAIQNFNGSDFCVRLPIPTLIRNFIDGFQPDIIHSHHPFLLGDSALRESWKLGVPIVFTHHTMYERYTHYVPLDSDALKRVAIQMATEYCNLCDLVIAPSGSVAKLLHERGVTSPVEVTPTGVDTASFRDADGSGLRERLGIGPDRTVIGHVGRLSKEKNLGYLKEAIEKCLEQQAAAVLLVVGDGDSLTVFKEMASRYPEGERVFFPGKMTGKDLIEAYAAMDLFAFSSQTETQGMVLTEAMSAGLPVVALDGPGVREIVSNGVNGILLAGDAPADVFGRALVDLVADGEKRRNFAAAARQTAAEFDVGCCVDQVIGHYENLVGRQRSGMSSPADGWDRLLAGIEIEWNLFAARLSAASAALVETAATEVQLD